MRILDDWACKNQGCLLHNKPIEYFIERGTTPSCEFCEGKDMVKLIHGIKSSHVSWSTWRI